MWMHDELIALEQEGIPFKEQAILVKDRYQARRVEEFLASKNIPTCCWRLDLVTESPTYNWLKKVFALLLQPKDKKRLLSLLFSMEGQEEACGQMARENNLTLFALAVVEWERVRDAFMSCGIGGLKRALFACRYNGKECLHSYFARQKKEEQMDLEQILEALSLVEGNVPRDIGAFSEALEHIEEYFSEDRDALLRRVDPEDEGVPILTMHRSKGLEFDVVYALGTASRTPQSDGDLEEIDAEKLRQIYVALTRAKKRSYIPLFLEQEGRGVPRGQAAPLELLLSCLSVGKNGSLDMWADVLYQSITQGLQEQVVKTLTEQHPQVFSLSDAEGACEKVYERKKKDVLQESSTERLLGAWRKMSSFSSQKEKSLLTTHASTSSGGALFGVQFHEAIALLLQDSVGEEQCENNELASLLHHALQVQLPTLPPLHEIPRDKIRCEVPFLFRDDSGYICGTIDLMILYDSKIYIVDWKTQEVDMSLREYILEERYDLQYSIYKKAAEAAFPQYPFGGFFFVFVRNLALGKESIVEGGQVCQ
jgi:exodeoxyribonuclease V beta subunit